MRPVVHKVTSHLESSGHGHWNCDTTYDCSPTSSV